MRTSICAFKRVEFLGGEMPTNLGKTSLDAAFGGGAPKANMPRVRAGAVQLTGFRGVRKIRLCKSSRPAFELIAATCTNTWGDPDTETL